MCYDCDMVYSLLDIGCSGEYEALQYKMDSSSKLTKVNIECAVLDELSILMSGSG